MTQSSGLMDATICNRSCKNLDASQRCVGTDCRAEGMAGPNTSKATQAKVWKRGHPSAVTPWRIQNKGASTKPAMATFAIGLRFREDVYGAFMSASCDVVSWLYLDVERGATRSTRSVFYLRGIFQALAVF